jgi:hypothetical protein
MGLAQAVDKGRDWWDGGRGIGSRVVTVEFDLGLFMPVNGPFRACLNGPGSCPPVGLGLGPSTARPEIIS